MSRKTPLSSQTRKVDIVIRKNVEISKDKIKAYCDSEFEIYAFIEHKGDIKPDTGEVEGVHYHICGNMRGSKIALSTRLNTLCKWFGFDNNNGIEIEQYRTLEGAIQYLTHKRQSEKTPHNKEDIVTNIPPNDFDIYYEADIGEVVTFDLLYCTVNDSNNIIEVIKSLGLKIYKDYRNVIWDMWKTLKGDIDYIK